MVKINGEWLELTGRTLADYLADAGFDAKRVAVERNGEIVPKRLYRETVLADGTPWKSWALWGAADMIPTREEMHRALQERHGAELQAGLTRAGWRSAAWGAWAPTWPSPWHGPGWPPAPDRL